MDFRNSLAISSLVHGWARATNSENVFEQTYSDHFDFFSVALSNKGKGFVISTPSTIMGIWPKVDELHERTYPHVPFFEHLRAIPDKFLVEKILKQWNHRYVSYVRN